MVDTDWRDPFILYLRSGTLPADKTTQQHLEVKSRAYLLVDGELYRRGRPNIPMKCVSMTNGQDLLWEIHEGICGNHASSKMLVVKAFRQGFYQTTVVEDSAKVVRKCEGCQFFTRQSHVPAHELRMIPVTSLFVTWGSTLLVPS